MPNTLLLLDDMNHPVHFTYAIWMKCSFKGLHTHPLSALPSHLIPPFPASNRHKHACTLFISPSPTPALTHTPIPDGWGPPAGPTSLIAWFAPPATASADPRPTLVGRPARAPARSPHSSLRPALLPRPGPKAARPGAPCNQPSGKPLSLQWCGHLTIGPTAQERKPKLGRPRPPFT